MHKQIHTIPPGPHMSTAHFLLSNTVTTHHRQNRWRNGNYCSLEFDRDHALPAYLVIILSCSTHIIPQYTDTLIYSDVTNSQLVPYNNQLDGRYYHTTGIIYPVIPQYTDTLLLYCRQMLHIATQDHKAMFHISTSILYCVQRF